MALVNAKLVKLLKKNAEGEFITDEVVEEPGVQVLRSSVLVSPETISESEGNYKSTGLLYISLETPEE